MPAKAAARIAPLIFVLGEDEFAVQQRGRALFQGWQEELGGMDHEIIDARAGNSAEALASLKKLHLALNTLPFFGGGKAIWFKDCSFLGDDRTSASTTVVEALGGLADTLKTFAWKEVRLVITAGKVDKRKSFFKTVQKLGEVEEFGGWSARDSDWVERAEMMARAALKEQQKNIGEEALAQLVQGVGPNPRLLQTEVEKLVVYATDKEVVTEEDVAAVAVRNRQAQAFALAEALGNRDLPGALRLLDEELWSMQFDKKKSEIGLLYGLIAKIRVLLMVQDLLRSGRLKVTSAYGAFKAQMERLNPDEFPADRRYSPLGMNPFVLFKAAPQASNYTLQELILAMETLLECNRRLVSSTMEERMVLQQAVVDIIGTAVRPRDRRKGDGR